VPLVRVAQVSSANEVTELQVVSAPTWVTLLRSVVSPTPICPSQLAPQHHSVPLVRVAQVW